MKRRFAAGAAFIFLEMALLIGLFILAVEKIGSN